MPNVPSTWQVIPPTDLDSGRRVETAALDKLGQNNNYLIQRWTGLLGSGLYVTPWAPGGSPFVEHAHVPVPLSADRRGLTLHAYVDPGANTGRLRVQSKGDGALVATGSATAGSGPQFLQVDLPVSHAANDTVALIADGATMQVFSWSLQWKQDTSASIASFAPKPSGARFVNDTASGAANAETDVNRPVTTEWLNRVLTNPRLLFEDRATCLFGAFDDLNGTPRWSVTAGTSRGFTIGGFVHARYAIDAYVMMKVTSTAATWTVTITDSANADVPVTFTQASTPVTWGGVSWYRAPISLARGDHVLTASIDTTLGGTVTIQTLAVVSK